MEHVSVMNVDRQLSEACACFHLIFICLYRCLVEHWITWLPVHRSPGCGAKLGTTHRIPLQYGLANGFTSSLRLRSLLNMATNIDLISNRQCLALKVHNSPPPLPLILTEQHPRISVSSSCTQRFTHSFLIIVDLLALSIRHQLYFSSNCR